MRLPRVRFTIRPMMIAVAVASMIVVPALAFRWYAGERTRSVHLPSAENEGIEVTLWGSQIGREDIARFPLHRSQFASVLRCLSPAVTSESARRMPMIFPPVGELRIRTPGGLTRRVVFVDAGKNPLCFTVDGVACLRERPNQGDRARLQGALRPGRDGHRRGLCADGQVGRDVQASGGPPGDRDA